LQVTDFLKDRVHHDAEWEENAWAKLLNSNQDILVLMQRLHEKGLITQDMIQMATLPTKPPPRQHEADSKAISVDANGMSAGDSAAVPQASSMMGGGYQTPSMMGVCSPQPGYPGGGYHGRGWLRGGHEMIWDPYAYGSEPSVSQALIPAKQ
jgi:hypothetical protein